MGFLVSGTIYVDDVNGGPRLIRSRQLRPTDGSPDPWFIPSGLPAAAMTFDSPEANDRPTYRYRRPPATATDLPIAVLGTDADVDRAALVPALYPSPELPRGSIHNSQPRRWPEPFSAYPPILDLYVFPIAADATSGRLVRARAWPTATDTAAPPAIALTAPEQLIGWFQPTAQPLRRPARRLDWQDAQDLYSGWIALPQYVAAWAVDPAPVIRRSQIRVTSAPAQVDVPIAPQPDAAAWTSLYLGAGLDALSRRSVPPRVRTETLEPPPWLSIGSVNESIIVPPPWYVVAGQVTQAGGAWQGDIVPE